MSNPLEPVKDRDVLISYLISDNLSGLINNNSFEKDLVSNKTQELFNSYKYLKWEDLANKVEDKSRLNRINTHRWFVQSVPVKYIGTWPVVGDLPSEWCGLSVIDIGNYIKNTHKDSVSIKKINSMISYVDELLKLLPPILVMGGEIRDSKKDQLLCYDSDDGSHRCIAAVLAGIDEIKCYVGMP